MGGTRSKEALHDSSGVSTQEGSGDKFPDGGSHAHLTPLALTLEGKFVGRF